MQGGDATCPTPQNSRFIYSESHAPSMQDFLQRDGVPPTIKRQAFLLSKSSYQSTYQSVQITLTPKFSIKSGEYSSLLRFWKAVVMNSCPLICFYLIQT
ncbi:hypothetical protein YC2023_053228 [Brassica napus]